MNILQWPFTFLMNLIGPPLVRLAQTIKTKLNIPLYKLEVSFVLLVLVIVWFFTGRTAIELIGVAAVFFTFNHATVANRLEEQQEHEAKQSGSAQVECYNKLARYFTLKEFLWLAYFIILGAWSALVGVILFLLYYPWRTQWRKQHPLSYDKTISHPSTSR